ncbi:MAG: low molecular weight phosphotyrosine protein phosphatase [Acidobacteriota bacterium]
MSTPSILVVCSANICRSPVAEALLRRRLDDAGHGDVTVSSGGTLGLDGAGAATHSVDLMVGRGLDLSRHRSRSLDLPRLDGAALILTMEQGHVDLIVGSRPSLDARTFRLAEMAGESRDVPDPYGGPRDGYERMVADVEDLIDRGLPRILAAVGRAG